ncbi:phytase [Paenibacillus sp. FSL M7-1455]|uniref:phytase n=1 Tax=Paenibacillus sp. FSL M7-1455 TaxID=2975316 RepID=UPI00404090F8
MRWTKSAMLTVIGGGGLMFGTSAYAGTSYEPVSVKAKVETEAVSHGDDAADDPAIWLHPTDPEDSKIIATNKAGGLLVYDLEGRQHYAYALGRMNNVDVRYDFKLGDAKIDIAGATNRTTNSIDLFRISSKGELTGINGKPIVSSMSEVYGFSLYHSLRSGKFYALVLGKNGEFEQYELYDNGNGKIDGKLVRSFTLGSQSEGLVVDDEYGRMYIAEEDVGVWAFDAEPGGGSQGTLIAAVDNKRLTADVEGLTMYYGKDGDGYLIVSSQGSNRYAVYDREDDNEYLGSFTIADGRDIDGTTETDGIDVLNYDLGDAFEEGLFVAQDDQNVEKGEVVNQNFKLVAWEDIADAFEEAGADIESLDPVNPRELKKRNP